jgi:DNA polymerase
LNLTIDFETRSKLDIKLVGLENYIAAAEPLCVAWAIDDRPVELLEYRWTCYLCAGRSFACELCQIHSEQKERLYDTILSPSIIKVAQNIAFERALLRKFGFDTPISQWVDTSVLSRYAGLPSKLADICKALKLGDMGKNEDGSRLIRKFCVPKKDGTYRDKTTDPADWQKFLDYCRQDVVAEREVFNRLRSFHLPPREKKLWELDDKINRRGWPVDMDYVKNAHSYAKLEKQKLMQELKALTGLANPNSRDQFLGWARSQGYEFNSLGKAFIKRFEAMLEEDEALVDTP